MVLGGDLRRRVRKVAFHVTGDADMVLRRNNTNTGGTTIDAGSMLWSGNNDLGGIAGDVVDNGALMFGAVREFQRRDQRLGLRRGSL